MFDYSPAKLLSRIHTLLPANTKFCWGFQKKRTVIVAHHCCVPFFNYHAEHDGSSQWWTALTVPSLILIIILISIACYSGCCWLSDKPLTHASWKRLALITTNWGNCNKSLRLLTLRSNVAYFPFSAISSSSTLHKATKQKSLTDNRS